MVVCLSRRTWHGIFNATDATSSSEVERSAVSQLYRLTLSACGQVVSHIRRHITSQSAARSRVMASLNRIYCPVSRVETGHLMTSALHDRTSPIAA